MSTEYSVSYPGGFCYACMARFVRVSNKAGYKHVGQFAFVRITVRGTERKFHVSCAERFQPPLTADQDHYAIAAGTSKKPAHL